MTLCTAHHTPLRSNHKHRWSKVCARAAAGSPYGALPGWALKGAIVKSGDDCRQELLALQLIRELRDIWAGGDTQRRDVSSLLAAVGWSLLPCCHTSLHCCFHHTTSLILPSLLALPTCSSHVPSKNTNSCWPAVGAPLCGVGDVSQTHQSQVSLYQVSLYAATPPSLAATLPPPPLLSLPPSMPCPPRHFRNNQQQLLGCRCGCARLRS